MTVLTALAAVAATPTALGSSGPWVMDYRDMSCVLSRKFGQGENEVTLGWRVLPLSDFGELLVNSRSSAKDAIRGKVVVRASNGEKAEGTFRSYPTTTSGMRVLSAKMPSSFIMDLPDTVSLTVTPQEISATTFQIAGMIKASAALKACVADTLKVWGVSEEEARLSALSSAGDVPDGARPSRGEAQWITADDYPIEAIRSGAQGTSTILWTIGVDGRVHDCRVVVPLGFPALDAAGCKAITLRGRYRPLRDAAGQPVAVHKSRVIEWMLPGTWRPARGPEPE